MEDNDERIDFVVDNGAQATKSESEYVDLTLDGIGRKVEASCKSSSQRFPITRQS